MVLLPQFVEHSIYAVSGSLASDLSQPRERGSLPLPGVFLVSRVLTVLRSVRFPPSDPEPSGRPGPQGSAQKIRTEKASSFGFRVREKGLPRRASPPSMASE